MSNPERHSKENGAASLAAIANRTLLQELENTLRKESKKSAFAIGGFIPIVDPDDTRSGSTAGDGSTSNVGSIHSDTTASTSNQVIVRWDRTTDKGSSVGRLAFPVLSDQESQLEMLVSDCEPATFGRDREDVYDESYRRAGKLDETSFSTNFNPYGLGVIDIVSKILLPTISGEKVARNVRAELYKLNKKVYSGPNGKFKPHVDTPRSNSQFGSLVVCLPYSHDGGQLVVRHGGDDMIFDWSTDDAANGVSWAAFYSDCEHEVLEVIRGHRITLTYNLYVVSTAIPRGMSALDPKSLPLYLKLNSLLAQPGFMSEGGTLGFYCAHAYAHTSAEMIKHLPWNLKGVDMTAYQALVAAGLDVELRPVIDTDNEYVGPDELKHFLGLEWDYHKWGRLGAWVDDARYKQEENPESTTQEDIERRDKAIAQWRERGIGKKPIFVGDNFRAMAISWAGGDGNGIIDLFNDGLKKYDILPVQFVNKKQHPQVSIVHLTYGNEAGIGTVYSSAALIFKIPPFTSRLDPN